MSMDVVTSHLIHSLHPPFFLLLFPLALGLVLMHYFLVRSDAHFGCPQNELYLSHPRHHHHHQDLICHGLCRG